MEKRSIGFIGGGRITKIFLQAFKNSNKVFSEIVVFDPNVEVLMNLKKIFTNIILESADIEVISKCDILFLAVHPPIIMDTLSKINSFLKDNVLIVSFAPKITIEKIKNALNKVKAIARVNPSAPGFINQGINPVAFSDAINSDDKEYLFSLLQILGKVQEVPESKIEAYAVISAMGSTYFWFQLQQLKMLGVSYGMNEKEAEETISDMIKGTVNTLFNSGITPEEVMDLVPVKPIGEYEETIKAFYAEKLNAIYNKIKP